MNAYFWEMGCLEAAETTLLIKVGLKESSQETLIAEFGEELVGKAFTAWSCSLCQTIWTRGLPTRDSSSITGLVLDKSFP